MTYERQSDNSVVLGYDAASLGNSIPDVSQECGSFKMFGINNPVMQRHISE
jgi:hypothetical protein